ncbi:MAG: cobalamin-dependent protein [Desulfobacterota bacterium]|nr:cobalamin-dependent protein [Thermodesulfobacteriota bacterium]
MCQTEAKRGKALRENIDLLANDVVERQYRLQHGVWERFGAEGRAKSVRDARYHLCYLAEAVDFEEPELFFHYIQWCKIVFAHINLPADTLPVTLALMRDAIGTVLPDAQRSGAYEVLNGALERFPKMSVELPSFLPQGEPFASLAQRYLDLLIRTDRHGALSLIMDSVRQGMPVRDVYLKVFQPVQHEVGRLWQMNRLSVAQEHYCTAATQFVMAHLYPFVFATEKKDRRLVAACIGGELHEMGIRMVSDLFEMEGWQTYYLGANTPIDSIVRMTEEQHADMVCVSTTLAIHLSLVADLIHALRGSDRARRVKVLVGGYPFNVASSLWKRLGADGQAHDAAEAIALAEKLAA